MKFVSAPVVAAGVVLASVFDASAAHADADVRRGGMELVVKGDRSTVYMAATSLAFLEDYPGDLQAYYRVVRPGQSAADAEKFVSPHIFKGPMRAGVVRDSYGPAGVYPDHTKICAGWIDPSYRGWVQDGNDLCATIYAKSWPER